LDIIEKINIFGQRSRFIFLDIIPIHLICLVEFLFLVSVFGFIVFYQMNFSIIGHNCFFIYLQPFWLVSGFFVLSSVITKRFFCLNEDFNDHLTACFLGMILRIFLFLAFSKNSIYSIFPLFKNHCFYLYCFNFTNLLNSIVAFFNFTEYLNLDIKLRKSLNENKRSSIDQ
jgi:hypothetical protein